MSDSKRLEIQNELIEVINSDKLAANLRPRADRILSRIQDPVRLTILGLPGSGKSTLVNLLLGSNVLTERNGLPTAIIKYGESPKSTCTLRDGSKQTFDHCNCKEIAALKPILLEVEMPLPALKKISVMEVVANGNATEKKRGLLWASKRTDIALWCTQEFTEVEQDLWDAVPENLKDHAFLLITKADILAEKGTLGATRSRLQPIGEELFKQVLSIDTEGAVNARSPNGAIDKKKMTDTGGRALVSAILRDVEQGIEAAFDQADILLRQHSQFSTPVPKPEEAKAKEPAKPVAESPAVEKVPEPEIVEAEDAPVVEDKVENPVVEEAPEDAANEESAPVEAVAETDESDAGEAETQAEPEADQEPEADVVELFAKTRTAYQEAVNVLSQNGRELLEAMEKDDGLSNDEIMSRSSESVLWLNDYLLDNGDSADPELQVMLDTTADASDLVQLLELEDPNQAPMDAISLVVQLKRDLEAKLCA